jgi:hypothetical protein
MLVRKPSANASESVRDASCLGDSFLTLNRLGNVAGEGASLAESFEGMVGFLVSDVGEVIGNTASDF